MAWCWTNARTAQSPWMRVFDIARPRKGAPATMGGRPARPGVAADGAESPPRRRSGASLLDRTRPARARRDAARDCTNQGSRPRRSEGGLGCAAAPSSTRPTLAIVRRTGAFGRGNGSLGEAQQGLAERAVEAYDSELCAELPGCVGSTRARNSIRSPRAIEAYQKTTDAIGDRLDLLDALDRLYTAQGDTAAVVELLERRMALAGRMKLRPRS